MAALGTGGVLAAKDDAYGGIIVDSEALPGDAAAFEAALGTSMAAWRSAGKRGIWLRLPLGHAALIPAAAAAGFYFHHAEEGYAMMTAWLPQDAPSTLPPNASHQVGIGAFILNQAGEVLVVQEKSGPLRGKGVWKMPTGLVNAGEDISEAAEREVFEETGVRVGFEGVLAIRQAHGFAHGKSDLFFCCAMRVSGSSTELNPCEREIEAAAWLPLDEYVAAQQTFHQGTPLYATLVDACLAWARRGQAPPLRADKLDAGLWGRSRTDLLMHCVAAAGAALPAGNGQGAAGQQHGEQGGAGAAAAASPAAKEAVASSL